MRIAAVAVPLDCAAALVTRYPARAIRGYWGLKDVTRDLRKTRLKTWQQVTDAPR
jgi:hypothetical protein